MLFRSRSVVRSAEKGNKPNLRVKENRTKVIGMKDLNSNLELPCIDPDELIGYNFLGEHADSKQKGTVVGRGENQDFVVEYADGTTTEQTYEEIINSISKAEEEGGEVWTFKRILNHKVKKKDGKEEVFVKVEWDIGPPTWEPLEHMRKDDPEIGRAHV